MNTYQMMNPEAFTAEYESEQAVQRELAEENPHPCASACEGCDEDICNNCEHFIPVHFVDNAMDNERDLFDIVREHEESEDWVNDLDNCNMYDGED